MKRSHVSLSVLGPLLALSAYAARSTEVTDPANAKAQVPHTAAARASADLISRAERAISGYADACAVGEAQALSRVTTDDLRVEYALDEPGTYLSMDTTSMPAHCAPIGGREAHLSNLWIFPTHDATSVFVQYEAQASKATAPQRQLALIEMRGDRIARVLNFAAVPPTLLASNSKTDVREAPCANQVDEMKAQQVSSGFGVPK